MTPSISADLYVRYRQLIGQIGPGGGNAAAPVPQTAAAPAALSYAVPQMGPSSVALGEEVTRQLIETQADASDTSSDTTTDPNATDPAATDPNATDPGTQVATDPGTGTTTDPGTAPTDPTTPTVTAGGDTSTDSTTPAAGSGSDTPTDPPVPTAPAIAALNDLLRALASANGTATSGQSRTLATPDAAAPPTFNTVLSPFDFNRNGSIDINELMAAVHLAGGTAAVAQATFNQFDPQGTGAITGDQLIANMPRSAISVFGGLSISLPAPTPQVGAGLGDMFSANALETGPVGSALNGVFSMIDVNGTGAITSDELTNAVTAAGGTADQASALYAQLDPDQTGSITMEQFLSNIPQVEIDANGVVTAKNPTPPAETASTIATAQATASPLPQSLSSNMLAVLLQAQSGDAV